jgi:hypothetical protein
MKWKEFKTRECKTVFGRILQLLVFHQWTQLIVSVILAVMGAIPIGFELLKYDSGFEMFFQIIMGIGIAGLVIFAVIGIGFLFIVKPVLWIWWKLSGKKHKWLQ